MHVLSVTATEISMAITWGGKQDSESCNWDRGKVEEHLAPPTTASECCRAAAHLQACLEHVEAHNPLAALREKQPVCGDEKGERQSLLVGEDKLSTSAVTSSTQWPLAAHPYKASKHCTHTPF